MKLILAVITVATGLIALPLMLVVVSAGPLATSRPAGTAGDTRLAWAQAFTAGLGATSEGAVRFAMAWAAEEGARPEANNPLNSTLAEPGSTVLPASTAGVRMYPTLDVGLAANLATILNSNPALGYQAVVDALRRDDLNAAAAALQHSRWCVDPTGPLGHECPGYGATILSIVASYRDPAVFDQAGRTLAGTTQLAGTTPLAQPADPASAAALPSLLAWLAAQLGKPYVWGGTGRSGYDCSGLVLMAFAHIGVPLPRTAAEQYAATAGAAVPLASAAPGDLLFWAYRPSDPATIHHVAVYAGAGQIIEAPREGVPVHQVPVWNDGGLLPVATRPLALVAGRS